MEGEGERKRGRVCERKHVRGRGIEWERERACESGRVGERESERERACESGREQECMRLGRERVREIGTVGERGRGGGEGGKYRYPCKQSCTTNLFQMNSL